MKTLIFIIVIIVIMVLHETSLQPTQSETINFTTTNTNGMQTNYIATGCLVYEQYNENVLSTNTCGVISKSEYFVRYDGLLHIQADDKTSYIKRYYGGATGWYECHANTIKRANMCSDTQLKYKWYTF